MTSESAQSGGARERRNYFRIEDSVYLEYRVLAEGEAPAEEAERQWPERLKVLNELSTVSRQANAMLAKLRDFYPDITQLLVVLNQKVDLLVALVMSDEMADPVRPNRLVNISAGGVEFHSQSPIEAGRIVEVRLILFPSYTAMLLYGEVVRCEQHPDKDPESPYWVALEFTYIRDAQRDAIVRHVTDRQSAKLREARQAAKDS